MICDTNSTHFLVREGNYWRSVLKESDEGKQIAIDLAAHAEIQERLRLKANRDGLRSEMNRRKRKLAKAQRKLEEAQRKLEEAEKE